MQRCRVVLLDDEPWVLGVPQLDIRRGLRRDIEVTLGAVGGELLRPLLGGHAPSLSARQGLDGLVRRRRLDVLVEPLALTPEPAARTPLAGLAVATDDEDRCRRPGGDRLAKLAEGV